MIINTDHIKELLNSSITSYRIFKETGIATQTLDNYRLYDSKIENMRLGIAAKLMEFYNNNKGEIEMKIKTIGQLEEYILNGGSGDSNDRFLKVSHNDVKTMAKDLEKGELFIYDKDLLAEAIQEAVEEGADEWAIEAERALKQAQEEKKQFIINDIHNNFMIV